jgi:predicted RNase H-like HicB family nuclease
MIIQAVIHQAEEGGYWAEVPSLPGCFTQAETLEEIRSNLLEAIQGWTEAAEERARRQLDAQSSILALAV